MLDLSYQADPAITTYFVKEVGAPRIFFDSDTPYFEPSKVLDSIEMADIADRDRQQIFHSNAERLIALVLA